jgi:tetratricopeptide (TPR) repeat protein
MQALDELVARWRKNPDPESTLALCAHLGTSDAAERQAELMREVANLAETWHRDNHPVMLSVGRMYLDAGLLAEAQAALIQAGKVEPNDAEAYRYLGEVLLRRGDAIRSEKTLARAIRMGDDDPETRLWHERSVLYVALQKRQGIAAVADEVARTAPHRPSIPAPTLSPFDRIDRETAAAAARPVRRSRPPLPAAPRASGRRRPSVPGVRRRGSTPPPADSQLLGTKTEPQDTLIMGQSPVPMPRTDAPVHPPSPFFPSESHAPRPARTAKKAASASAAVASSRAAAQPRATAQPRAAARPRPPLADLLRGSLGDGLRELDGTTTQPDSEPGDPFRGTFSDAPAAPSATSAPPSPKIPTPAPASGETAAAASSRPRSAQPVVVSESPNLTPEMVLSELARVGLYEQASTVVPAWEAAPRPAPRKLWIMAGALGLAAALGVGVYRYALGVQAERAARAQELGMRLASALDSGSRMQLRDSEADFQSLFELDSRGREPAMLWLENRVMHTLLDDEPVSGIESALQRARAVGVEEQRLIFGRLASSLAAGDLPGAGATIAEWDARAKGEALYQLLAGMVFERAGNPEALERYVEAVRLQPDLKLAHAYAARLALLTLGPVESRSLVEVACARLGAGPASDVLRGLEWATSPFTDNKPPTVVAPEISGDLSPLLQDTASAVVAVRARREGRLDESTAAFERALGPSATPAMAAWIGYQALDAGDVEIARRAAVKAVQLSAQHKGSHALAARIALAEGRLDAAREAVRGVDPSSRDALLIEAVSAYENLQGPEAARLIAQLPADASSTAILEALAASDKAIAGTLRPKDGALRELANEQRLWGAIIAVDVALDAGQLDAAERIAQEHAFDAKVPAHATRLMRLRRYRGQGPAALELAPALLDARAATPRAVSELVLAFVAEARVAAATSALGEMKAAAAALGPWLEAIVEKARGREPNAAKLLTALEPPTKARPLVEQVVALRALASVKDKRAKPYYAQLERRFRAQPDVLMAGKELGLIK